MPSSDRPHCEWKMADCAASFAEIKTEQKNQSHQLDAIWEELRRQRTEASESGKTIAQFKGGLALLSVVCGLAGGFCTMLVGHFLKR
jgi:hypothetical protein